MAFKGKGSKDMYAGSPKLEKKADGKVGVTEAEKTASKENGQVGGEPVQEDHMARHSNDRHVMHAKHEHEHATHKGKDKKEMHARHREEMKAMHKRHEKELAAGGEEGTNGLAKE